MSSYNNIRKIKYTKTPSDVVSLYEYIIFEDAHAKEKFVVFKFSNNVNQRLFDFKFEVLQYNKDNELLEKSTVSHKDFIAEANDLFVPNAKLKVNFECESLEVRLESATFDRAVWSGGEFKDNPYSFASYAETLPKTEEKVVAEKEKDKPKADKKQQKKNKLGFNIRNIFRRNKAVFPAVFNVILAVILIALVVGSAIYFKRATNAYVSGDFLVTESSAGYVTVLSYEGQEEEIEIPSSLDDKYVSKIAKGAFRNSQIKSLTIATRRALTIEGGAFANCKNLTSVTANSTCGEITVMEGAFKDCGALASFVAPTAKLCKACFDGTENIKYLTIANVVYNDGKLLEIFSGVTSYRFDFLDVKTKRSDSFYEGVNR